VVQKVRPQHLWDDEDPLRVADLFEYVLGQQRRRRRRTLRRARRAQIQRLARERERVLLGAVRTPDTRKPILKQPAVEEGVAFTGSSPCRTRIESASSEP
jgi:hypothetical protein